MNVLTAVLLVLGAWNPARGWILATLDRRRALAAVGVTALVGVVAVALGRPAADALGVTAPTLRLAGGVVVAVLGVRTLLWPMETWMAERPVLAVLSVESVVAAVSVGAPGWRWAGLVGVVASALSTAALAEAARRHGRGLLPVVARGFAVLAMLTGTLVAVVAVQTV